MRSENIPKTRLSHCQIAKLLSTLQEFMVAEHDRDGSFYHGCRINAFSAHTH